MVRRGVCLVMSHLGYLSHDYGRRRKVWARLIVQEQRQCLVRTWTRGAGADVWIVCLVATL